MEKRTLIAIALSFLVIFFWTKFVYKPQQVAPQSVQIQQLSQEPQAPLSSVPAEILPADTAENEADIKKFDLPGTKLTVSEPSSAIKSVLFDKYPRNPFVMDQGFYIPDPYLKLAGQDNLNSGLTYTYSDQVKRVSKAIIPGKSLYSIDLEVRIKNISPSPMSYDLPIILARFDLARTGSEAQRFQDITVFSNGKADHPSYKKEAGYSDIKFVAMRDQYFCAILEPESTGYSGFVDKVSEKVFDVGVMRSRINLAPGSEIIEKFRVYLGPQDTDLIGKLNPDWGTVIHFGKLDLVAQAILGLLKFLFSIFKNWGLAIVFLSLAIYVILFPLSVKQMKSMKEMQALQPKMEQLRKTYANDAKKLNEETMKLYKEHKVNPLGGCLPMILQIPIFISLYQVLSRSIALKGAEFLWIKDLSEPDRLFKFPGQLPFLGEYFNILPVLMAIGMFIQQKMSAVTASGQSAEQQKMMMILFPILFGVMFYNMPSGLVLYWFLNSTFMLLYQIKIMKVK